MSKILFYLLIILILLLITLMLRKKLGSKTKPFFVILLLATIIFSVFFEIQNIKKAEKNREVLTAFNQGKSIICKDLNISNDYFNYEFGTASFISKDNNLSLKSLIIDINHCRLKNE